jgi:hypothetical protein
MSVINIYLKTTAAFGAGFVIVHGFRRRQHRLPFSVATEAVCVPRDAMIGAVVGPILPLVILFAFNKPCPLSIR